MANVVSAERAVPDAGELIGREIQKAREELRPVSRRSLALILVAERHTPFREALDLVDTWCEEHASAVPCYVGSEFGIYWLKFLAVAFGVAGLVVAWQGVRMVRLERPGWPWWAGATLVIGLAAFVWVVSLEREAKR
ncbi:hypothetical protein BH11ARM2_BH11ARM2_02970 [soil metagenome]